MHDGSGTAHATAERLFLALWPDDAVRIALQALVARLGNIDARVIPARSLHLTLAFLANVDATHRHCLEQACDGIRARELILPLERVRWRARGGVLWIEPAAVPPLLIDLVAELRLLLGRCQFEPETRPYRAHVTLARAMRRRATPVSPAPILWRAQEFCLVKSVLEPSGARYEIQRRWTLG